MMIMMMMMMMTIMVDDGGGGGGDTYEGDEDYDGAHGCAGKFLSVVNTFLPGCGTIDLEIH